MSKRLCARLNDELALFEGNHSGSRTPKTTESQQICSHKTERGASHDEIASDHAAAMNDALLNKIFPRNFIGTYPWGSLRRRTRKMARKNINFMGQVLLHLVDLHSEKNPSCFYWLLENSPSPLSEVSRLSVWLKLTVITLILAKKSMPCSFWKSTYLVMG